MSFASLILLWFWLRKILRHLALSVPGGLMLPSGSLLVVAQATLKPWRGGAVVVLSSLLSLITCCPSVWSHPVFMTKTYKPCSSELCSDTQDSHTGGYLPSLSPSSKGHVLVQFWGWRCSSLYQLCTMLLWLIWWLMSLWGSQYPSSLLRLEIWQLRPCSHLQVVGGWNLITLFWVNLSSFAQAFV